MIKKRKNKLVTLGLAACMSLAVLCSPVAELPVQAAAVQDEGIMPLSDVLGWKYAIMDHKFFKRLYNYSKKCWAGDWIFVRDIP